MIYLPNVNIPNNLITKKKSKVLLHYHKNIVDRSNTVFSTNCTSITYPQWSDVREKQMQQ